MCFAGIYMKLGELMSMFSLNAMTASVTVHVDKDGAMAITQNPTLAPAVQKSKHEPAQEPMSVSALIQSRTLPFFLETFFKLYPTAAEKELAYYVKDGVLAPVSGDYVFSELVNPVFTKDGDNRKVSVSVKYLDNKSKMTQISSMSLYYIRTITVRS